MALELPALGSQRNRDCLPDASGHARHASSVGWRARAFGKCTRYLLYSALPYVLYKTFTAYSGTMPRRQQSLALLSSVWRITRECRPRATRRARHPLLKLVRSSSFSRRRLPVLTVLRRWPSLLGCGARVLALTLSDPKMLDFSTRMVQENPKTGNLGVLLAHTAATVRQVCRLRVVCISRVYCSCVWVRLRDDAGTDCEGVCRLLILLASFSSTPTCSRQSDVLQPVSYLHRRRRRASPETQHPGSYARQAGRMRSFEDTDQPRHAEAYRPDAIWRTALACVTRRRLRRPAQTLTSPGPVAVKTLLPV